MNINGLKTINIDGKDYWTLRDFSKLTGMREYYVNLLVNHGNRLGKIKALKLDYRVYIEAQELFEYRFAMKGRPHSLGDSFEVFFLKDGELHKEERSICRK
jgi:hypothetical protein